jgi:nucleotide-binding universal stress UspA family protein
VDPYEYPAEDLTSIVADFERSAREDLDEAMEKLPPTIAAEPVLVEGLTSDMLAARSEELDLLFAGSRAYGPPRAVLLGSVTYRLLHQVACPLVVLPRGTEPTLRRLFRVAARDRTHA